MATARKIKPAQGRDFFLLSSKLYATWTSLSWKNNTPDVQHSLTQEIWMPMTLQGPVELEFSIKNSLTKPARSDGEKLGCVGERNAGHSVKKKGLFIVPSGAVAHSTHSSCTEELSGSFLLAMKRWHLTKTRCSETSRKREKIRTLWKHSLHI